MPTRALVLTALLAAAAAAPASPAVFTRTVHEQLGMTRQVTVGDRTVAWTRCSGIDGPTQIWAAPRSGGIARRVPNLSARGACEPLTLVGAWRDLIVALVPQGPGLRSLVTIDRRTGSRTVIEADTPGNEGVRVTAADLNGPRVVWLRESGSGNARVSETILGDLRRSTARRVLYSRTLAFGAVRPLSVWVGPSGRVVVRQLLSGALYGYGERDEQAVLVGGPRPVQIVRLAGGARLAAADLSGRWFVYSVARDDDVRARVIAYDLTKGTRRTVRLARLVPRGVAARPPAVPAPSVSGNLVAWRERQRAPGGYRDRVVTLNLAQRKSVTAFAVRDTRGQRLFLSQPSVRDGRVLLAEVRLSTAYGASGGFLGETPVGARSRLVLVRVR